ncbi:cyclopropane-fatty-acyl-phospholipid synthase family protein [Roseateles puraquae]|jgi:cyclopropane-fatty-acyl-phospholipid synthase|uniref:cyclopropane-fatty-acyl-phospholipid synthase family protein n=1 Tax=Roseateles puraquae TaxID=431059 RepID=UPI0031D2EB3B
MPTTTTTSLPALAADLPRTARRVLALLQHLRHGSLDLQTPEGDLLHFGNEQQPRAAIRISDWAVCDAALKSGDVGFAESFMAGHWTSPDLSALLELFIRNRTALEQLFYGGFWGGLLYRLRHALNRNTRSGSRKNIQAHYDLGNEFYRLWLDPTMNYSSAWFEGERGGDLVAAQQAKMRRALAEAEVAPGSRVLEIGCGWGAVAEVAARDFNASLTGVTLSHEQLAWARDRLAQAGLAADLRLQDYRDIADEPFDAVVSIEMFEAVGREYWDGYFRTVHDKLKPGGRACIQSITIRDDLFDRYVRSTDFIQQYIFPGGLLPSPSQFRLHAERAGLRVVNELAFGADYAETLRRWRETFLRHDSRVRELGFDTRFMRLWEFYLAYCQAAFAAGNTDVMQFTLVRD